jgi:alpha-ketoglutarate-dependent 2,4-dichlorophenoxyacetate dioxygenase
MDLRPLSPVFGAEVLGVSLADVADTGPRGDQAYAFVRAAFEEYSVLLFRRQEITDEAQAAYSRRFGVLEVAKVASLGEGTPFSILTNVDRDTGKLVAPDHKEALRAKANQLWHTDSSFKQRPALASVLSARIIPPTGGETQFASQRAAWARLPAAEQAMLFDACVWHDYAHSRGQIAPHLASGRERAAMPPACWRIRWRNPVNGCDSFYLASHACAIEGMADAESKALLARLMAHISDPAYTYTHEWQAGDVVMWDNRATMHRGRPWPAGDHARLMKRTTISASDADGLAAVRPAEVLTPAATDHG